MVFGKDQDPRTDGADIRWSKPRQAPKDNRVRMLPLDSEIERHYAAKAESLGLVTEGMSRNSARRLYKRLSDSDVTLKIKRIHAAHASSVGDDDELLLTHLEREAEWWRTRARRDRQVALAHELVADEAEAALADLVLRLGLDLAEPHSIEDDFS